MVPTGLSVMVLGKMFGLICLGPNFYKKKLKNKIDKMGLGF